MIFLFDPDGQGFIKEHKSKVDRVNEEQNDMAQDVLQQNERQATSMEFALVLFDLVFIESFFIKFPFELEIT